MQTLIENEILCKVQTIASDVMKSLKMAIPMLKKQQFLDNGDYTDCFLLQIKEQQLTVTAFDGNETIIAMQELEQQQGEVLALVPGIITNLLEALPSDELITLNFEAEKLIIIANEQEYVFPTHDSALFPTIKQSKLVFETFFSSELISKVISLKYAIGSDIVRPNLMCILFDFRADGCQFVASNGKIIHRYFTDEIKVSPIQVLLNSKSIDVLKTLMRDDDFVKVEVMFNHVVFTFQDGLKYIARRVDEKYPDIFNLMFIGEKNIVAKLYRKTLQKALERINVINVPDGHLELIFEGNRLQIEGENPGYNMHAKEVVELIETLESSISLCFSLPTLLQILKNIAAHAQIDFIIENPNKRVLIETSSIEQILIMPLMNMKDFMNA